MAAYAKRHSYIRPDTAGESPTTKHVHLAQVLATSYSLGWQQRVLPPLPTKIPTTSNAA